MHRYRAFQLLSPSPSLPFYLGPFPPFLQIPSPKFISFGLVLWCPEFNKSRQYGHGYDTYSLGPGNLTSSYITEDNDFPFLRIHQYLIVLWERGRPHDPLQHTICDCSGCPVWGAALHSAFAFFSTSSEIFAEHERGWYICFVLGWALSSASYEAEIVQRAEVLTAARLKPGAWF